GAERVLVGNPADWVMRTGDPRRLTTRGASAYLKLAEGCNRSCAFCVIPELRGKQRSRAPGDIIGEALRLAQSGVKELNLVSQDTIAYGRDLPDRPTLAALVRRIADISGVRWVRLFYLYPETLDAELIELLADHPRVVPYVDMPLQHAAEAMLRRMRRGHGGARLRILVERLRTRIPQLVFRTAFIVGHPGETQAEFEELRDFLRWAQFDRVGVFVYSDEETAPASSFDGKVLPEVAQARARALLTVQRRISRQKNRALVGSELDVLVEGPSSESEWVMVGRHAGQAPEVDGCVYISGGPVFPGQIRRVRVVGATDYDLHGEVFDEQPEPPRSGEPVAALHYRSTDGRRVALRVTGGTVLG
ncbi:MAG TPA: MiaB/RimO family radical SAM methylthiotransferase, partial [Polyangiaceae bacterium]